MGSTSQPRYLAGLAGDGDRIDKLSRESLKSQQKEKTRKSEENENWPDYSLGDPLSQRAIALGVISKVTKGEYDLRGKMGVLLTEAKRVQFTTLDGIREAYSLAFSERVRQARPDRIDKALADKRIDSLSAVRNLIVHKAGVADAEYADRAKGAPSAPQIKEGDALQLDGEVCRSLI